MVERNRSIDINKLSKEDIENLQVQIGAKVREICDEAVEKANRILNIYGMKAKMQIAVQGINEESKKAPEQAKKKKGRPRKDTNL